MSQNLSLDQVADRVAIQELVFNYAYALDTRDDALFRSLWAPDAVWTFPQVQGMTMEGYDAIVAFYARPRGDRPPSHHLCSNLLVTLDGDRAHGQGKALSTGFEQPHFVAYEDEYVRLDGRWKLRKRSVAAHMPDAARLPGRTAGASA